jgi:hypothetical protein
LAYRCGASRGRVPISTEEEHLWKHWLIWPEDGALVAHELVGDSYQVIATIQDATKARIKPFEAIELDVGYILGRSE